RRHDKAPTRPMRRTFLARLVGADGAGSRALLEHVRPWFDLRMARSTKSERTRGSTAADVGLMGLRLTRVGGFASTDARSSGQAVLADRYWQSKNVAIWGRHVGRACSAEDRSTLRG